MNIPRCVAIDSVINSRYFDGRRPLSWDNRTRGIDLVRSVDGEQLKLISNGGQSTPNRGWQIILTDGDATSGYNWTLYSMPQSLNH